MDILKDILARMLFAISMLINISSLMALLFCISFALDNYKVCGKIVFVCIIALGISLLLILSIVKL